MTEAATDPGATAARWYRRAPTRALWRVLASVVVLVVVGVVVGEQALRAGTAVLTPVPVLLALLLGAVWRSLAATRWLVLARALGAPLTWGHAVAEYYRSELVNQVVPGGVVGDVDRARRHGLAVGLLPAARAVFLERTVGQLTLVAATVVTVLVRPELLTVQTGVDRRTVVVVSVVLVLVAGVALALWQPWRGRTGPLPVLALAVAVLLSLGVLACFVTLFVLATRATGTDAAAAPLPVLVPAVLVVLLLSGIPLTVSGWGAREAGAALCFAAVGLAASDGVAAAVGYGLLSLVSALPGLVPLLRPHARADTGATQR
jgi:uncharacterized membrane protein YbhN (UPF0104 family)